MNTLSKVGLAIIIVMAILLIKLSCSHQKNLERAERWEDNYRSEAQAGMGLVKKLSVGDLYELRPDLKKLIEDSIKAAPRQIESVVTTKVVMKWRESVPVIDTVLVYLDTTLPAKAISFSDACISLTAIIPDSGGQGVFDVNQYIDVTAVTKWSRKNKALWGLFRYGRKIYSTQYVSNCPSVSFRETESIKIVKE